jgi:hypothetical protein
MRKAITALALLLFPWSLLGQNGPLQGTSTVGGISATTQGAQSANKLQGVIPSALITVYLTGTQSPATLYTALGSPAANPFYSNAATANNPGGWITYAPINVGYDIVASSGQGVSNCSTGPLCYAQPVTLCVDCFAGGSGGGGGGAVNSVSNSDSSLTVAPNTGSVVVSLNPANANNWTAIQTFPVGSITNPELQYPSTTVNGQSCVLGSACTIAIGGVNSVFNTDGTLVISPTTGNVAASLNLGKANNWTAIQTFIAGSITNVELANSSVTVNGQSCVLGGTCTIATGSTTNALTINNSGSGASSGSTFNGSSALTISYNTLGAPGTAATNTFTGANTFSNASFLLSGLASLPVSGTYCLQIGTTGQLSTSGSTCGGGGGGAVNSVANSDGTLTISPTTGSVVASMALGHANTWTATQTFPSASITNAELANTSITINSTTCTLGSTCTVSGGGSGTITGVTAGTNLSGGGSSGTVTLNVIASPVFTTTRNTGNVTPSSSGIWTMYNAASANETDFANNPSSGSGGFNFYNTSSGGTLGTAILAIDGSGNGTFQGTGTFLGSGSPGITMAPTTTPATGSNNYGSVPLTFQSNFYSAGSFTAQWNVAANIGTGSTPSPALVFSGPAALPVNDDVVYELDPSIAATSSVNYNSPNILLKAPYWNGTASAVDTWYILDTLGTGANPFSALTLSHGGTTGNATVSLPGIQIVNPTLAYPIALTNNTASTSGSNVQAPSMTWNGTYWNWLGVGDG